MKVKDLELAKKTQAEIGRLEAKIEQLKIDSSNQYGLRMKLEGRSRGNTIIFADTIEDAFVKTLAQSWLDELERRLEVEMFKLAAI